MKFRHLPWGDYALRVFACVLLAICGYTLLSTSTFALRMNPGLAGFVPGMSAPQSIAAVLCVLLSALPLAFGRRFLAVYLAASFVLVGIGSYWWTSVPWDELITESNFPTNAPAAAMDYLLVAGPVIVVTLYVVLARASRVRKDAKERGVDDDEARRAAAAGFLAGASTLVVSLTLAGALLVLFASGVGDVLSVIPRGLPAILLAAGLVVVAWMAIARKEGVPRFRVKASTVSAPVAQAKKSEA